MSTATLDAPLQVIALQALPTKADPMVDPKLAAAIAAGRRVGQQLRVTPLTERQQGLLHATLSPRS